MSSGLLSKINTFKQAFTANCVYILQEYKPCFWKESLCLGKDGLKAISNKLLQIRSRCSVSSMTVVCTTRISSVQEINYYVY